MGGRRRIILRATELVTLALLGAVPFAVANPYALGLLTLLAIYGIVLAGLDISVGYLGQVNLAQAAFLGLGAYTAGIVITRWHGGIGVACVAATAVGLGLGAL